MKKILFPLAAMLLWASCAFAGNGEVIVYIWSEYLPDAVIEQFTEETGIKVTIATYDSNEAMYAKVKMLGGEGYDIVVPTSDFITRMGQEGLLMPLDHAQLPNMKHIGDMFLDLPFDPANRFSLPYMWGSTSIGVNTDYFPESSVQRLADLWKPEFAGQLLMPNDMREVFSIALKRLGYSLNDTDPAHLQEAFELLKELMPSVKVFNSESAKQPFLFGEVNVGVNYNGEFYMAAEENPAIRYVYPEEGYSLWMDNLAILKNAPNPENAHAFLNFIHRPEISAVISEEMGYATPNDGAKALLPEEVRNNTTIYPTREQYERGEYLGYIGDKIQLYEELWTRLKTGN